MPYCPECEAEITYGNSGDVSCECGFQHECENESVEIKPTLHPMHVEEVPKPDEENINVMTEYQEEGGE
tara:strand:+ start:99 stop:305 length:207 start_codon:yes stop_codon:yes gene_type:complete